MRASAEPLDGNKVRLSVEVDEPEVERAVDDVVRTLARRARVPGFRPGKVPRRVLEARMGGTAALRGEALKEALPDFYARAVVDAEVDPITSPEIEVTAGQESGALSFEALVEVRPKVAIPGYQGLVVTVPSPVVTDEDIQRQIDSLREADAELEPTDRPAIDGDQVTIDLHGTDVGGQEVDGVDDYLYEVGSGTVLPELDTELRGAKPGDVLAFRGGQADDPSRPPRSYRVLVKRVQKKLLPQLSDEWVAENTESQTVDDLRDDVRTRLGRVKVLRARLNLREAALRSLCDLVDDEVVPGVLVDEEAGERIRDLEQRLQSQGASIRALLETTDRSEDDLVAEVRADAVRAVKVDLALRALADAEDLELGDDEFEQEIASTAERLHLAAGELRRRLERAGRIGAVRSEQRKAKALSWLLEHVSVLDEEGNPVAREALEVPPAEEAPEGDDAGGVEDGGPEGAAAQRPADVTEMPSGHGTVTGGTTTEEGS